MVSHGLSKKTDNRPMMTRPTRLIGIIGHPIAHTLSPAMHNAAFASMGLPYCYLPFDVYPRHLGQVLRRLGASACGGLNVTIPHKQAVLPFLDGLSREARLIGAVNTIEFRGSKLIGHNTDGRGFAMAFRREYKKSWKGKRILLLGAGGAARAVSVQLLMEGARHLTLTNRTEKKARRLAIDLRKHFSHRRLNVVPLRKKDLAPVIGDIDILINATSAGMKPNMKNPLPSGLLRSGMIICDLIYRPSVTPLLREAHRVGAKASNGMGMLLWQGVLAFEIFVGRKPPVKVMKQALLKALKKSY